MTPEQYRALVAKLESISEDEHAAPAPTEPSAASRALSTAAHSNYSANQNKYGGSVNTTEFDSLFRAMQPRDKQVALDILKQAASGSGSTMFSTSVQKMLAGGTGPAPSVGNAAAPGATL